MSGSRDARDITISFRPMRRQPFKHCVRCVMPLFEYLAKLPRYLE